MVGVFNERAADWRSRGAAGRAGGVKRTVAGPSHPEPHPGGGTRAPSPKSISAPCAKFLIFQTMLQIVSMAC